MPNSTTIAKFLESNPSMSTDGQYVMPVAADLRSQYRPDKIFARDEFMKWDMIYNNIDTPYRMTSGAVFYPLDRTWIATEVNDLKDFKL